MKNVIKWFHNEKGNGFIEYKNKSIFIHYSTTQGESVELKLNKAKTGYKVSSIKY